MAKVNFFNASSNMYMMYYIRIWILYITFVCVCVYIYTHIYTCYLYVSIIYTYRIIYMCVYYTCNTTNSFNLQSCATKESPHSLLGLFEASYLSHLQTILTPELSDCLWRCLHWNVAPERNHTESKYVKIPHMPKSTWGQDWPEKAKIK